MNKNSRIYVAGHKGLTGSAIWEKLKSKGYTNLFGKSHIELDLTENNFVRDFFYKTKPEYVFLAASYSECHITNKFYRADFIFRNLQIQNNIIEQCYHHNIKKLLLLGDTSVYPKNAPQPIKEEYLLTSQLEYDNEPYSIAKITAIKLCESFNLQYGTNFLFVILPNLYEYEDNFNINNSYLLPNIIRKIHLAKCLQDNNWSGIAMDIKKRSLNGLTSKSDIDNIIITLKKYGINASYVELWGTGKSMKELLWSYDMADALIFIMENINFNDLSLERSDIKNCHINVGTGKYISIKDLADTIASVIGYKGNIKFNSSKPDMTTTKLTDVTKLHRLGWRNEVSIKEDIKLLYRRYLDDLRMPQI